MKHICPSPNSKLKCKSMTITFSMGGGGERAHNRCCNAVTGTNSSFPCDKCALQIFVLCMTKFEFIAHVASWIMRLQYIWVCVRVHAHLISCSHERVGTSCTTRTLCSHVLKKWLLSYTAKKKAQSQTDNSTFTLKSIQRWKGTEEWCRCGSSLDFHFYLIYFFQLFLTAIYSVPSFGWASTQLLLFRSTVQLQVDVSL